SRRHPPARTPPPSRARARGLSERFPVTRVTWSRRVLRSRMRARTPTRSRARARGLSEGFTVTRVTWSRRVLRSRMRLRVDEGGFLELRVGWFPVRRRSSGVTVFDRLPSVGPQVTRVTGAADQSAG